MFGENKASNILSEFSFDKYINKIVLILKTRNLMVFVTYFSFEHS